MPVVWPSRTSGDDDRQYEGFLALVPEHAGLPSRADAADAVRATLRTLAERVRGDTANNLAAQFPRQLAGLVRRPAGSPADTFDANEFSRRVAERAALAAPVTEGEILQLWAQRPGDLLTLCDIVPHSGRSATEAAIATEMSRRAGADASARSVGGRARAFRATGVTRYAA